MKKVITYFLLKCLNGLKWQNIFSIQIKIKINYLEKWPDLLIKKILE